MKRTPASSTHSSTSRAAARSAEPGANPPITVVDDRVVLNGTAVINRTDNLPQNGSMHIIDMVLLPPEAVAAAPQ